MDSLSAEVLGYVSSMLHASDVLNLRRVSRHFKAMMDEHRGFALLCRPSGCSSLPILSILLCETRLIWLTANMPAVPALNSVQEVLGGLFTWKPAGDMELDQRNPGLFLRQLCGRFLGLPEDQLAAIPATPANATDDGDEDVVLGANFQQIYQNPPFVGRLDHLHWAQAQQIMHDRFDTSAYRSWVQHVFDVWAQACDKPDIPRVFFRPPVALDRDDACHYGWGELEHIDPRALPADDTGLLCLYVQNTKVKPHPDLDHDVIFCIANLETCSCLLWNHIKAANEWEFFKRHIL